MTTTSSLCSLKFLNKCNLGKIHLLPECFYFIFPALQMEQRSFDFGSYEKYEPMRFCFIFLKIIVHCASAPTFFPINSTKKCLSDNGLASKKRLKIYKYQQAIQPKRKRYSMYDATYGTVSVTPNSKLTSQPQFRGCLSLLVPSSHKALVHAIVLSLKIENLQCLPIGDDSRMIW